MENRQELDALAKLRTKKVTKYTFNFFGSSEQYEQLTPEIEALQARIEDDDFDDVLKAFNDMYGPSFRVECSNLSVTEEYDPSSGLESIDVLRQFSEALDEMEAFTGAYLRFTETLDNKQFESLFTYLMERFGAQWISNNQTIVSNTCNSDNFRVARAEGDMDRLIELMMEGVHRPMFRAFWTQYNTYVSNEAQISEDSIASLVEQSLQEGREAARSSLENTLFTNGRGSTHS